jgi:hypothetical protein
MSDGRINEINVDTRICLISGEENRDSQNTYVTYFQTTYITLTSKMKREILEMKCAMMANHGTDFEIVIVPSGWFGEDIKRTHRENGIAGSPTSDALAAIFRAHLHPIAKFLGMLLYVDVTKPEGGLPVFLDTWWPEPLNTLPTEGLD